MHVRLRERLEDFVVDEIPAYLPAGAGEHLFVRIRKRGLATPDAARRLAVALGVQPRDVSWAGLKDKHAVTTQWLSVHAPRADEARARAAAAEDLEILEVSRHGNKLKPGHLRGNRFALRLSLDGGAGALEAALRRAGEEGVPNRFGYQRFGRADEDAALALLQGARALPRDPRARRMAMSAAQSAVFNRVLEAREGEGTWARVLPGDLAKKADTGGMFRVPLDGPEAEDAARRGERGELSATGPIVGVKMPSPDGAPGALEQAVVEAAGVRPERLVELARLGEGSRRPFRLRVEDLDIRAVHENEIQVHFSLAKGSYATTVLTRACDLSGFELVDVRLAARGEDAPRPDEDE